MCCDHRSCQTDVQCKEACKCWVSLKCEDPPKKFRSATLDEGHGENSSDSPELEEEEDVEGQDYSNEKTDAGYQNAVSVTLFSCLKISDVKRVLTNHWDRL